uniref:Uncharacterized protein n=1 Tax=Amphimedon queenslandica TaxID=400682 RepID=A0A1X7TTM8_AMPQE
MPLFFSEQGNRCTRPGKSFFIIIEKFGTVCSVQQGVNRDVTITIAAGVLLQGHGEKEIFYVSFDFFMLVIHQIRLQRDSFSVSHRSTITIADKVGQDFDNQVKEWCHFLLNAIFQKITVTAETFDGITHQPIEDQPDAIINILSFEDATSQFDAASADVCSVLPP